MSESGDIIDLGPAWHYRLESPIARSTYGEIWQASWLQGQAPVAVKLVNRENMARHPAHLQALWPEALRREADILRRIEHRNIVRFRHDGEDDGMPVLVLEQLHGSLARWLKERGAPLPPAEALEILRQVASGLAAMHANGLRHLDLKPENLLLTAPGPSQRIKIADLGSARGGHSDSGPAVAHLFTGSPGWLAPEQVLPCHAAAGNDGALYYRTDARTDVYGLGLLLFYLLTGECTDFNQSAAEVLQWPPREVLNQQEFLGGLADAGLTTRDAARLDALLKQRNPALAEGKREAAADSMQGQGTWVPRASGTRHTVNHEAANIAERKAGEALRILLKTLLVGDPGQRLQDAAMTARAISQAQFSVGLWR
jgi:serine/threonine protein kinase